MSAALPIVGTGISTATTAPILAVAGLTVAAGHGPGARELVSDLSFDLRPGETLAIAGESGSGKSMTSLAIMGLLPKPGVRLASGSVMLASGGKPAVDITRLPEAGLRQIRGNRIAMIFQEPMTSLNPVLSIGRQLTEVAQVHAHASSSDARSLALQALEAVRIPDATRRLTQYPHELSGGQRQRVMIAMALMLKPDVLIADEPTTALDVTVQAQVLGLLQDLQKDLGTAILLITHDMGVVAEMADRVLVMRQGRKVEENTTSGLFGSPSSDYASALLAAVPRIGAGAGRRQTRDRPVAAPVVEVTDLVVRFPIRGGLLSRPVANVHAVDGISFHIAPGETLSLVGESGCGKSTTARALAGLVPYRGALRIGGRETAGLDRAASKAVRRDVQMIFQDPYASLDPRMTVGEAVREPLDIHEIGDRTERRDRVEDLIRQVGLPPDSLRRYPHEFSGGQRQRISIARALALKPKVILCDESVSALDVSIQARVLDLLRDLQSETGVAYLFISHDMAVVENISDRVAVMYAGRIVETGARDQVFSNPAHPYTRRLIEAVPIADPGRRRPAFPRIDGDVPSATRPIDYQPPAVRWQEITAGHWVAQPA